MENKGVVNANAGQILPKVTVHYRPWKRPDVPGNIPEQVLADGFFGDRSAVVECCSKCFCGLPQDHQHQGELIIELLPPGETEPKTYSRRWVFRERTIGEYLANYGIPQGVFPSEVVGASNH